MEETQPPLTQIPEQQPEVKTEEEKPKRNKVLKFFIYLFASVFLLSLGVLGFYTFRQKLVKESKTSSVPPPTPTVSPTPTPESTVPTDWKTYKNEKYGFELKYPSDMDLSQKNIVENSGVTVNLLFGEEINLIVRDPKLEEVEITRNWVDLETLYINKIKIIKELSESSAIGGNPPFLTHVSYLLDLPTANLFITYSEKKEGDYQKISQTLDQILSTFKFLDEKDSVEGKSCGGIAANLPDFQCPQGYKCQLEGDYPDAMGGCIPDQ